MPNFKIELFRPSVPSLDQYLPYLQQVDKNQFYSNFGPLSNQFKSRLALNWHISNQNIELFSSGTMALIAGMVNLAKEGRPYCILPSWTFVATAHAVVAAGLKPVFVDVDYDSMQLTIDYLEQVPSDILEKSSLICIVAPFGAPLDLRGIEEFARKYDLEVICDCAAGFESFEMNPFHSVISLHATKTFGIGEGGVLISPNTNLLENAKAYSNFGFKGQRVSVLHGVNGKLSEFHAAVGLAALDSWDQNRKAYYEVARQYLEVFGGSGLTFQKNWGKEWVSSTCVVKFQNPEDKQKAIRKMNESEIQCRDWWNSGCHKENIFNRSLVISSENTTRLSLKSLGIPFHRNISQNEIQTLKEPSS